MKETYVLYAKNVYGANHILDKKIDWLGLYDI